MSDGAEVPIKELLESVLKLTIPWNSIMLYERQDYDFRPSPI